jgi:hypothetical protein
MTIWADKEYAADKPFKIVPKRDFGDKPFWIKGKKVKHGFVVTRGGCNIMPGATWFQTIEQAARAILLFQQAQSSDEFWSLWHNR